MSYTLNEDILNSLKIQNIRIEINPTVIIQLGNITIEYTRKNGEWFSDKREVSEEEYDFLYNLIKE